MSTIFQTDAEYATARGAQGDQMRALRLLDADLQVIERAESFLQEAEQLMVEQPREAFELIHRAALRVAGVLVTRANRERKRPLPLNVWAALRRLGRRPAARAEDVAVMVAERELLDRDPSRVPTAELLRVHLENTRAHTQEVREEVLDVLPGRIAALAS